jgi:hypothetical protein
MSSQLFHVEVLETSGATVLVEVTDTHHRITAPETETFFFAVLREPAGEEGSSPFASACTMEQMCDEDFVEANTSVYLARVEVVAVVSRARATYRVQFTDAKWAVHLRPGLAWGTESYDIGEPTLRPALERLTGEMPAAEKHGAKPANDEDR